MPWFFRMFGAAVALVFCVLVLVAGLGLLLANTSVGAKWLSERWLAVFVDPSLKVTGSAEVDFWPQLAIRAKDLIVPIPLVDVAPVCLQGNPKDDPAPLRIESLNLVMDWQRLLSGQIVVPVLALTGVTVTQGLSVAQSETAAESRSLSGLLELLRNDVPTWWRSGWQLQLGAVNLQKTLVQQCSIERGMQPLYSLNQARFSLQADVDGVAQAELLLDGFDLRVHSSSAPLMSVLQENGLIRDGRLQLETVRSRWRIQEHLARMESLLWVGTGPTVEFVSGVMDLEQGSLDVMLTLQTIGSGSVLKIPGVEIILRRSSLPLRIYGQWTAPTFQLGQE